MRHLAALFLCVRRRPAGRSGLPLRRWTRDFASWLLHAVVWCRTLERGTCHLATLLRRRIGPRCLGALTWLPRLCGLPVVAERARCLLPHQALLSLCPRTLPSLTVRG